MKGNPYSRILDSMRRQGKAENEQPMSSGTVLSVNPLSIRYNNVAVTGGVKSRLLQMPETIPDMIEREAGLSPDLKAFLKGVYDTLNLQEGDDVIVQKSGNNLYIIGKM